MGCLRTNRPRLPKRRPNHTFLDMSYTDILAELPRLTQRQRREIAERALALDDEAQILEQRRHLADEAFRMLDTLEDEDAKNPPR